MADVRNEIAAGGFHARVLGLVVDVDDREPAIVLGQKTYMPANRQPGPAGVGAFAGGEVDAAVLAGRQRAFRGQPARVVEQPVTDQAQLAGPAIGVDDVTVRVDHDYPYRRSGDDVLK